MLSEWWKAAWDTRYFRHLSDPALVRIVRHPTRLGLLWWPMLAGNVWFAFHGRLPLVNAAAAVLCASFIVDDWRRSWAAEKELGRRVVAEADAWRLQ